MDYEMIVDYDELSILNACDIVYWFKSYNEYGKSDIYFNNLTEYNLAQKVLQSFWEDK